MDDKVRKATNECIARNLVGSLESLLNGKASHQIISDSYGHSAKRIVITYDEQDSSSVQ